MKKIRIHRREVMGHLPKEVKAAAVVKIGSVYVNRQPLKGVEGEEEKELLKTLLDVAPDHVEWPRHVKQFWSDMTIKVPFEGVELTVSKDESGKPHDLEDYLRYRFALRHPYVAANKEEAGGKKRFYIVDDNLALIAKNKKVKLRKDADKEFIKASEDEDKMNWILRLLSKQNTDKLSKEQKENLLFDLKDKEPAKFLKVATDKHLELKAEIEKMVEFGVLRKIGNQVIYIDDILGETMNDTIVYLRNKKNSSTLTVLRAKLKEAISGNLVKK